MFRRFRACTRSVRRQSSGSVDPLVAGSSPVVIAESTGPQAQKTEALAAILVSRLNPLWPPRRHFTGLPGPHPPAHCSPCRRPRRRKRKEALPFEGRLPCRRARPPPAHPACGWSLRSICFNLAAEFRDQYPCPRLGSRTPSSRSSASSRPRRSRTAGQRPPAGLRSGGSGVRLLLPPELRLDVAASRTRSLTPASAATFRRPFSPSWADWAAGLAEDVGARPDPFVVADELLFHPAVHRRPTVGEVVADLLQSRGCRRAARWIWSV